VISETRFAGSHSAFWQQLLPMTEEYVRALNKSVTQFADALPSDEPPSSRGVVNELGFRFFVAALQRAVTVSALSESVRRSCIAESVGFVRSFRQADRMPVREPTQGQQREAQLIGDRLLQFFSRTPSDLVLPEPRFAGCGWIDECYGDVLVGYTLVEVKAGDRLFRGVDLRQLLVYCALNFAAKTGDIATLCLVNPRLGILFQESIEKVCQETSGRSAAEVLGEIVEYISEPEDRYPS